MQLKTFSKLLLMVQKSGDHQLRLVVCPKIYRVLAPSQVVQDFFHQTYQNETLNMQKEQCHTSHRSKVLGPWSTIYPNLGLVDYQACPGLERHGSAGGHPTPPNIFKSQYFHIETHSFGLQQKSHGKMHPARSPFSELYRGPEQTARFSDMFFAGLFSCFWKVGFFKIRFEGMKRFSNVRSMFWRMMKILLVYVDLPTDTQRLLTWTS